MLTVERQTTDGTMRFYSMLGYKVTKNCNALWRPIGQYVLLLLFELSSPQCMTVYTSLTQFLLCLLMQGRHNAKRSGLRSSLMTDYMKPRLSTKFRERAFCFAGPHVWNQLPQQLRAISNLAAFKKHLKTHFFNSVCVKCSLVVLTFVVPILLYISVHYKFEWWWW